MPSRAVRDFGSMLGGIRRDIFALCRALRFEPTWQQVAVLKAVQDGEGGRNFIAVKSGQGPGKSAVDVVVALWRSLKHAAPVILTAPTQRQCRDAFLTRAREILDAADPTLRRIVAVTATGIRICGQRDVGVKTVTATKDVRGAGYHHPHLSIIGDEASGIERDIMEQFHGTLSNHDALFLLTGNPTRRDCYFFDCFNKMRDKWRCFTFNAEDTARDYPHIVSPARNEEIAEQYGRNSDVYRIRVLGEFPFSDPDCVMSSEDLERCTRTDFLAMSKILRDEGGRLRRAHQFGLDFARHGGDETVVYARLGNAVFDQFIGSHVEPGAAVDWAFAQQAAWGWRDEETWYVPDAGGMGQGVLRDFAHKPKVLEFHVQNTPLDSQYANRATEAWFNVRKKARAGQLWIPNDDRLIQQLSTRRYTTRSKDGKLIVDSTDTYMSDGHDSPDRAVAFVQAHYDQMAVGGRVSEPSASAAIGREVYDPTAGALARQRAAGRAPRR